MASFLTDDSYAYHILQRSKLCIFEFEQALHDSIWQSTELNKLLLNKSIKSGDLMTEQDQMLAAGQLALQTPQQDPESPQGKKLKVFWPSYRTATAAYYATLTSQFLEVNISP